MKIKKKFKNNYDKYKSLLPKKKKKFNKIK